MELPVIIEVALNGETSLETNPNVPRAADEIQADARACAAAGATILHAHADDIRATGATAAEAYLASWRTLLHESPEMLWYPTVAWSDNATDRYAHYELLAAEIPTHFVAV